jgi:hypothetical protein
LRSLCVRRVRCAVASWCCALCPPPLGHLLPRRRNGSPPAGPAPSARRQQLAMEPAPGLISPSRLDAVRAAGRKGRRGSSIMAGCSLVNLSDESIHSSACVIAQMINVSFHVTFLYSRLNPQLCPKLLFRSCEKLCLGIGLFSANCNDPALTERAGVGSIPANPDARNVPSFRRWRCEMKLSPFND